MLCNVLFYEIKGENATSTRYKVRTMYMGLKIRRMALLLSVELKLHWKQGH